LKQDLPVYYDGLGSVTAVATVLVRSNVSGELTEVHFKEGQEVKKGDLIAVIDPRPYQVALAQAQANLVRDTAQLKDAKLDQQRYMQLSKEGVISQQQSDTQNALSEQLEGAVEGDQANIESAKLNLVYCHITSPVDGRVGLRLVDPGNIVHTTDTNGLLLITQMEPITVIFVLPEDNLNEVAQAMKRGTLTVKAMSRDNGTELGTGTLLTIDNTIDQTTGTYKLRAVFDNKDRALWPNQFVNARLLLRTEKNAVVIPTSAIQNGGNGTFVYTVKPDKTVQVNPVAVGVTEGNLASISQGVSLGDVVVVDGQDRLRAGMQVDARFDRGTQGSEPGSAQARGRSADKQGDSAPGEGRRRHGGDQALDSGADPSQSATKSGGNRGQKGSSGAAAADDPQRQHGKNGNGGQHRKPSS
jgi:multidrug efflux system membrane fusion protein